MLESKEHQKFMGELLGRIRHSVFDIPQNYFALTLANMIEFQQPELANKFIFIVQEVMKTKKLEEEFN